MRYVSEGEWGILALLFDRGLPLHLIAADKAECLTKTLPATTRNSVQIPSPYPVVPLVACPTQRKYSGRCDMSPRQSWVFVGFVLERIDC